MSSGLPPDAAAQAQARREAAANLGPLRKIILSLSSMLPANGGARPVREVLAWLRREDADRLNALRDELRREAAAACDVSDAEAKYWEAEGNKACGSGKFSEAVFMYTRGVMYAGEDEALASLLCGRSAVFLAQGRHGEALADAHAACMHAPNNWKALKHRGVCLQKMGLEEEGARDIHAAANTNAEAGNRREVICKILQACRNRSEMEITAPPRQKEGEEEKENNNNNNNNTNNNNNNNTNNNTNEEVSSQTTINITYKDNRKGVEANNRIEPGAVMTEAPVAHVLYDDHWCIRCCHCLRVTQALYPGASYRAKGKLSRGLFCSEECASQCWERYGQRETSNSFFHLCPMDALLAARMMSSDSALSARKSLRGDFTGELYPAAIIGGYETAVSLCAVMLSAVSEDDADRLRFAQRQVILCGFELKFFTGSQIIINTETNDAFIDTPQSIAIGKALYTSASQYRHSCDPNCFISFVGNPLGCSLSLTVRATRHVAAGEELTVAYHNMTAYKAVSAQVRRRALAERCGFICSCHACRENKEETVTAEKKNYYIQAGDLYQKGCRLIREGQYDVAVTVLSQSYTIAMEQLCPPPRPPQSMIPKTHMALARAFNRLGNNEKCVENLLAKSKLEHRLYGENHVEYVDDYIRLAYFADLENERRRFAEQAKACLARFYAPSRDLSRQMSRLDAFVLRKRD